MEGPGIKSLPRQIRYSVRRMIRNPGTVMSTFAPIQQTLWILVVKDGFPG